LKENKFGVDIHQALEIYQRIEACSHLNAVGVDCHIGSQLLDLSPYQTCFERVFELIDRLHASGITLQHVDLGGGIGIRYSEADQPPSADEFAQILAPFMQGRSLEVFVEPGRSIVGEAGIMLTRVEHIKETEDKNFALVDAAMTDLLRPALYSAWHDIASVNLQQDSAMHESSYDVVGPVCESGDFLGKDRSLCIQEGSLLAVYAAGAYGFVMSSNYNTRVRAAEILVDSDQAWLVRRRETIEQLLNNEIIPEL